MNLLPLLFALHLFPCCLSLAWLSMKASRSTSSGGSNSKIDTTFPLSTRQALIDKSKAINSATAEPSTTASTTQYSTVGWSNRAATVLTPAAIPGVYTADRPFLWNNIDVGCRMTVIELQDGSGLWIHSPVALDGPLETALQALNAGPEKYIVSPNYEHVKFAQQWANAYPNAQLWACPGLAERMPDVPWTGELPYSCRPPAWTTTTGHDGTDADTSTDGGTDSNIGWDWTEIQPLHIDTEVNPFTNKPFFNEVIFYHKPSKTLLTTDLYWNYPRSDGIPNSNYKEIMTAEQQEQEQDWGAWELAPPVTNIPFGSRLWKVGMDQVFRPFYLNLMVKPGEPRQGFCDICDFVATQQWGGAGIDTVIPAHGDILRGKDVIRTVLRDFFNI